MACLSRGLVLVCVVAFGLVLGACPPPPTMSDESPGQSDCGMLDPNVVLGNKLCPDQRSLIRNEGKPMGVKLGPGGGMTWSYEFHSGDVFGQRGGSLDPQQHALRALEFRAIQRPLLTLQFAKEVLLNAVRKILRHLLFCSAQDEWEQ